MKEDLRIQKGKILVYRVFDIGEEIDLAKALEALDSNAIPRRLKILRDRQQALIISNAPLQFSLGQTIFTLDGNQLKADIIGKIWDFGTLSLTFEFPIPENTKWTELISLSQIIQNYEGIDLLARETAKRFTEQIKHTMTNTNEWECNEDYIIYFFEKIEGIEQDALKLLDLVDVPALILGEAPDTLSVQMKKNILENKYQYAQDDLAVIDWNSALIYEPSAQMDIPDVIEFALNQLLEMRYYDDLLDKKLSSVYNAITYNKISIFSERFSKLSRESAQKYMDISEIVETIENSLKAVGDFYLSTIFRATSNRFRFQDWQKSIDNKLSNLAEISKMLHTGVHEIRSNLLEIIVILLVAFEGWPILKEILQALGVI